MYLAQGTSMKISSVRYKSSFLVVFPFTDLIKNIGTYQASTSIFIDLKKKKTFNGYTLMDL